MTVCRSCLAPVQPAPVLIVKHHDCTLGRDMHFLRSLGGVTLDWTGEASGEVARFASRDDATAFARAHGLRVVEHAGKRG